MAIAPKLCRFMIGRLFRCWEAYRLICVPFDQIARLVEAGDAIARGVRLLIRRAGRRLLRIARNTANALSCAAHHGSLARLRRILWEPLPVHPRCLGLCAAAAAPSGAFSLSCRLALRPALFLVWICAELRGGCGGLWGRQGAVLAESGALAGGRAAHGERAGTRGEKERGLCRRKMDFERHSKGQDDEHR